MFLWQDEIKGKKRQLSGMHRSASSPSAARPEKATSYLHHIASRLPAGVAEVNQPVSLDYLIRKLTSSLCLNQLWTIGSQPFILLSWDGAVLSRDVHAHMFYNDSSRCAHSP